MHSTFHKTRKLNFGRNLTIDEIMEACDLFERTPSMETAAIRDAAYAGEAVSKAALANRVSAGAHCIVLESPEASDVMFDNVEEDEEELGEVMWTGI